MTNQHFQSSPSINILPLLRFWIVAIAGFWLLWDVISILSWEDQTRPSLLMLALGNGSVILLLLGVYTKHHLPMAIALLATIFFWMTLLLSNGDSTLWLHFYRWGIFILPLLLHVLLWFHIHLD